MTEKRFKLTDFDSEVEMLELLNKLHEENEQLKEQNKNLYEKLKFVTDAINYKENLRNMMISEKNE